jgi:hypothetical protein
MPFPVVWSERPEPNASALKDCAYSAGLTALVYGDKVSYPLGIYTVAEREALERSDDQPNETGASLDDLIVAIKRRYGITLTKNGPATLSAWLDKDDIALVVTGKMGNLAAGGELRRWDPTFTGPHAVCVVNLPGNRYIWLDPLAPNKFAGDVVTKQQIVRFSAGLAGSIAVRRSQFDPTIYTKAQYDAVVAALADTKTQLDAANRRIASAKIALGA